MTYVLAVRMTAKAGEEGKIAEPLAKLVAATRQEPGCLMYQAHRDPSDPRVLLFYEQYADESAVEAHRESEHFKQYALGELFPLMESRDRQVYETID